MNTAHDILGRTRRGPNSSHRKELVLFTARMESQPKYKSFTVILLIVAYRSLCIVSHDVDTNRKWFFDIPF